MEARADNAEGANDWSFTAARVPWTTPANGPSSAGQRVEAMDLNALNEKIRTRSSFCFVIMSRIETIILFTAGVASARTLGVISGRRSLNNSNVPART